MNIVFMGTPRFAAVALERLLHAGEEICLVVSQPDRERGRGRKLAPTPVKEVAMNYGVRLEQPVTPKLPHFVDLLTGISPELIVVVSYGHILKSNILTLPKRGCVNVHPSLLPKYRGAAPMQWTIIRGEVETGVTTFFMNDKMDSGDIIEQIALPVGQDEIFGELEQRLAHSGAELLLSTVQLLKRGEAKRYPQDDSKATYAPKIDAEMCRIDWSQDAKHISGLIRGLSPQPGAYCSFRGKRLKFLRAHAVDDVISGEPGELCSSGTRLLVKTGKGGVWITELQPEGRRPMKDSDFINGYHPRPHERME